MTAFAWKILGIDAKNGVVTSAKYFVSAQDGDQVVETEGYWTFQEPDGKIPFDQITEQMVVEWIKKEAVRDGKPMIETRLEEQMQQVKAQTTVVAPWLPQTFTPEL
jgi:hypothetical protein